MKVFKNWQHNDVISYVIFLGKNLIRQKRILRNLKQKFESRENIGMQQGIVVSTESIFVTAKYHFNLDGYSRRKKINK